MRKWVVLLVVLAIAGLGAIGMAVHHREGLPVERYGPDSEVIPPAPGTYKLELVGVASKKTIRLGEGLPFAFHLKNAGSGPVSLISNTGYVRCPLGYLEVRDGDLRRQTFQRPPGCCHLSPLSPSSFITVSPGEEVEVGDEMLQIWKPERPGTYTAQFTMDSRGAKMEHWHPFGFAKYPQDPQKVAEMMALLRTVPQTVLTSEPITITVVP